MSDDKVLQELYTHREYISDSTKVTQEYMSDIIYRLIDAATKEGLSDCFVSFRSTTEPYEDYLGDVALFPCGYREKNEREIAEEFIMDQSSDIKDRIRTTMGTLDIARLLRYGKTKEEVLEFLK